MTPILQNRQLRFREVKCPDQGHLVRSGAGKPMQVKMKVKKIHLPFLVSELGKQHVFTSSNYNGVSFYSEHQEAQSQVRAQLDQ